MILSPMELTDRIKQLEHELFQAKKARETAEKELLEKSKELERVTEDFKISHSEIKRSLSLKTSELESVFGSIVDAYVMIDLMGNVLKMNQAAVHLLGYDVAHEPFNLISLVKSDYLEYTMEAFKRLYMEGSFSDYRAWIRVKDGSEKLVQVNSSIIYGEDGKARAAHGIVRDITEDAEMKDLIKEQKNQLDIIVNNSPVGISLSKGHEKGLLMANDTLCSMLGYTREEFSTMHVLKATHPEDMQLSMEYLKGLYENKTNSYSFEKRYLKKNGDILWSKTSVTGVRDESGEILYEVATIEDISKEKLALEKLKRSENRLSTLITNLQSAVLLQNGHGKILIANSLFCDMFGIKLPASEISGLNYGKINDQIKHLFKDPRAYTDRLERIVTEKQAISGVEFELANSRILSCSYVPIFKEGKYDGHLWSYEDITLQKNYKENLKAQKDKYSSIIANMNLGLVEIDENDTVQLANHSFCEMSGFSIEDVIGNNIAKMLQIKSDHALEQRRENRRKGISHSYETQVITKNGETRYWLVSGAPNYDTDRKVKGSIAISLDITDLKVLEAQKEQLLHNLEKQNQQLNEYAHIVSHDLKAPLRGISALLTWTKEDFRDKIGPEGVANIEMMEDKIEKMDCLIENILHYSSIEEDAMVNKQVDLNEVIKDILHTIYVPEHIQIKTVSELPTIYADKTRMQQLFQNLISNAINYNDKENGLIEIDCRNETDRYIFSLKDNGMGIPKEYHQKIFKIFNSVGNHKKSTGIGLSIVKKVIDLYKGEIWLESEVGTGTTFYFSFKK